MQCVRAWMMDIVENEGKKEAYLNDIRSFAVTGE
jgi:hypothetical protein